MHILRSFLVAGLVSMAPAANAQDKAEVARGKTLVESNCARCHCDRTDRQERPSERPRIPHPVPALSN